MLMLVAGMELLIKVEVGDDTMTLLANLAGIVRLVGSSAL